MDKRSRVKDWYTDANGVVDYEEMCDDLMPPEMDRYQVFPWIGNDTNVPSTHWWYIKDTYHDTLCGRYDGTTNSYGRLIQNYKWKTRQSAREWCDRRNKKWREETNDGQNSTSA